MYNYIRKEYKWAISETKTLSEKKTCVFCGINTKKMGSLIYGKKVPMPEAL